MAVRVKLRIRNRETGKVVETVALVNSGFEATTRKLVIPQRLAEVLELWPPKRMILMRFGTAGGETGMIVVPESIEVQLVLDDGSEWVVADAVISPIEREVLISDKLGGALGIMIEDLAVGIWRHKSDPPERKRSSYPPQYWE